MGNKKVIPKGTTVPQWGELNKKYKNCLKDYGCTDAALNSTATQFNNVLKKDLPKKDADVIKEASKHVELTRQKINKLTESKLRPIQQDIVKNKGIEVKPKDINTASTILKHEASLEVYTEDRSKILEDNTTNTKVVKAQCIVNREINAMTNEIKSLVGEIDEMNKGNANAKK